MTKSGECADGKGLEITHGLMDWLASPHAHYPCRLFDDGWIIYLRMQVPFVNAFRGL